MFNGLELDELKALVEIAEKAIAVVAERGDRQVRLLIDDEGYGVLTIGPLI